MSTYFDTAWLSLKDTLGDQSIPLQSLDLPLFRPFDVSVSVLRTDLLCLPVETGFHVDGLNGNKLFKLLPNLFHALQQGKDHFLTFGGVWSNHLHATALACSSFNLKSIGLIRGERTRLLSDTLVDCVHAGMNLYFLPRSYYRELQHCKTESKLLRSLFGGLLDTAHIVPSGGSNTLGVLGAAYLGNQVARELLDAECQVDSVWMPTATGGTVLGIASGMLAGVDNAYKRRTVLPEFTIKGVSVLANKNLPNEISQMQSRLLLSGDALIDADVFSQAVQLIDGSLGGYASTTSEYLTFLNDLERQLPFAIDHVYIGKLFYKLWTDLQQAYIPNGQHIVLIHTGGQQGRRGLDEIPVTNNARADSC